MKSRSAAEASPDAKTRRAAQRPVTRKRTQAKPQAAAAAEPRKRAPRAKPKPRANAAQPPAAPERTRNRRNIVLAVIGAVLLAVVPAASVAAFLLIRGDESSGRMRAGVPLAVSAETLDEIAGSFDAPVYWAGPLTSSKFELTTTRAGTFVRYLPAGVLAGDPRPDFTTIATYPLANAYATAARRGTEPGMASREMPGGGVAVWSRTDATSVYLAYPQVPHLVEVYAQKPAEARRLALSGDVRPVR